MRHIVHLGDCLDTVTGLASLPDKSVDHVICDPPYEAEAHTKGRRVARKKSGDGTAFVEAPLTFGAITDDVRLASAQHMVRIARRWIVIFCQIEAVHLWRDAIEASGGVYKRAGVWIKPDGMPQFTGDRPGMGFESIVCCHAPGAGRSRWNGGGKHGVWIFPKHNPNPTGHQTEKPLPLMEALIRDFTDPGETILDPFAGSGTTGVACKRLGRGFIGWERDPKYHAIAERRIAAAREQLGLFAGGA